MVSGQPQWKEISNVVVLWLMLSVNSLKECSKANKCKEKNKTARY